LLDSLLQEIFPIVFVLLYHHGVLNAEEALGSFV